MTTPALTPEHHELLDELAKAGPSRAADLCGAFADLEGWTVTEFVNRLADLATLGLAEVRNIGGLPFWCATKRREETRA